MKNKALISIIVIMTSMIIIVMITVIFTIMYFDPIAVEERRYESYIRRQQHERSLHDPVKNFFLNQFWPWFFMVVSVGGVLILFDMYIQRRKPLVRTNDDGVIPVPRDIITDGQLIDDSIHILRANVITKNLAAIHQPGQMPQSISYHGSPVHVTDDMTDHDIIDHSMEQHNAESTTQTVPSFRELVQTQMITPDLRPFSSFHDYRTRRLLLGYDIVGDTIIPAWGSWMSLYSAAIAGLPSSGKTTTSRFLMLQSALMGARFFVIDPENVDGQVESLATTLSPLEGICYLDKPAREPSEIARVVRSCHRILNDRFKGNDPAQYPIIIAVDEFTNLMMNPKMVQLLKPLLELIAIRGRKWGVFAFIMGQNFKATRTGGTELRDVLAAAYIHRMRRRSANLLLNIGNELPDTSKLPAGVAYRYQTSGDLTKCIIPNTTNGDAEYIAKLLARPGVQSSVQPPVQSPDHDPLLEALLKTSPIDQTRDQTKGQKDHVSIPSDVFAILQQFYAGKTIKNIIMEHWPETTPGPMLQQRSREVQSLIRKYSGFYFRMNQERNSMEGNNTGGNNENLEL